MALCDEVRRGCAEIAERARWVRIDLDRVGAIKPSEPPALDPGRHYLEGGREEVVDAAGDSAEQLAEQLARGMPFFDDTGFWKRAQITANDLALAGAADFTDLDRLTIFADNLVPHVLRMDGVLVYDPRLADHVDSEQLLPPGEQEREIRACTVPASE